VAPETKVVGICKASHSLRVPSRIQQAGIRVYDVVKSIALIVESCAAAGGGGGSSELAEGELVEGELVGETRRTPVLLLLRGSQRADLARVACHLQVM
jgi:hypothetical protein